MKKLIITPCFFALMLFTSIGFSSTSSIENVNEVLHNETETFKVYGNCGMCKKRIESSLKNVDGIKSAIWDVDTKMITVVFNPHEITLVKVKGIIAAAGHDTDEVKATEKVYKGLPGCCQYDRAIEPKHKKDNSGHNHQH